MENNELQHHGTKGMKWGQRLYQNKDGSLTALGRARMGYKKRQAVKKRKATVKAKAKAAEEKKKTAEEIAKEKERVLKSRSAKELYDKAPLFDDAELNKAYNRLVLEKNIKNLQPEEVSKGKKFVNAVIEGSSNISKLVGFANAIDNNFGQIVNRHKPKNASDGNDGPDPKTKSKQKEKGSTEDNVSKPDGIKSGKGKKPDDDGPLTGEVRGEGTSKGTWKPSDGPTVDAIFRDFSSNPETIATKALTFVENNPRLIETGSNYVTRLLERGH